MTVKELREVLIKYPNNAEVYIGDSSVNNNNCGRCKANTIYGATNEDVWTGEPKFFPYSHDKAAPYCYAILIEGRFEHEDK